MGPCKSPQQKDCWPKRKANNAARIPASIWKIQRPAILKLYLDEDKKLEDVILHMTKYHNFSPTKRQYVHQLAKWGITKYNKRRPDALCGDSDVGAPQPGLQESPTSGPTAPSTGKGNSAFGQSSSPFSPVQHFNGTDLSPGYAEPASGDDFDTPAAVGSLENDLITGHGVEQPEPGPVNGLLDSSPFPTDDLTPEQLKIASHAFFAASDDEMAFPLLHKLHSKWPQDQTIAMTMARSTHAPNAATIARAVLPIAFLSSNDNNLSANGITHGLALLLTFLDIYIHYHEGSEDTAVFRAQQLAQSLRTKPEQLQLLQEPTASCGRPGVLVDLVVYQVLAYVKDLANGERANEGFLLQQDQLLMANPGGSLEELFARFHDTGVRKLADIPHGSCLQHCLEWCGRQLHGLKDIPHILADISSSPIHFTSHTGFSPSSPHLAPEDSSFETWAQQYEIFAFLWQQWRRLGGCVSGNPNAWDNTSERQIGMTAAELLATTCWLIVNIATEDAHGYSDQDSWPPPSSRSSTPEAGPSNYMHLNVHPSYPSVPSSPVLRPSPGLTTQPFTLSPTSPFYQTTFFDENNEEDALDFDARSASAHPEGDEEDASSDVEIPSNLADLARKGVAQLQSLEKADLWGRFLDQMGQMSELSELDPNAEAFKDRALVVLRGFILDTVREGGQWPSMEAEGQVEGQVQGQVEGGSENERDMTEDGGVRVMEKVDYTNEMEMGEMDWSPGALEEEESPRLVSSEFLSLTLAG